MMKITIGQHDAATNSVAVTFVHAGITHKRSVNACLKDDGSFDLKATKARVEEVAQGVEGKIALGLIVNATVEK